MNLYQLIRGLSYAEAEEYAARLPCYAKVIPHSTGKNTFAFAVDVPRTYTGGRL